jgi:hypothetical protein
MLHDPNPYTHTIKIQPPLKTSIGLTQHKTASTRGQSHTFYREMRCGFTHSGAVGLGFDDEMWACAGFQKHSGLVKEETQQCCFSMAALFTVRRFYPAYMRAS